MPTLNLYRVVTKLDVTFFEKDYEYNKNHLQIDYR